MGTTFEGSLVGTDLKIAIVVSRFNDAIGKELLAGAKAALFRHGVAAKDVDLAWVPGAFEIPLVARRLAATGRYNGVLCLGVVIRGATPHFDYIAGAAASGIAAAMSETGVPILFGVLTTDTLEQALERAGAKAGNKGTDAAVAAIEMANLMRSLDA
ncbi:MAG: 6,7-dimethyl-8-ribityllumazine synthase [Acidobacteria bacterium]|nr:6,7-dimethyl-8-ribityllumazine synthase [Acidobacteriota bacterium]